MEQMERMQRVAMDLRTSVQQHLNHSAVTAVSAAAVLMSVALARLGLPAYARGCHLVGLASLGFINVAPGAGPCPAWRVLTCTAMIAAAAGDFA
jgi:hypothetical protein